MHVGAWVYDNFDLLSGISFLPHSDHSYRQAPYQDVEKKVWNQVARQMPKEIDWSQLAAYEEGEDNTAGSQTLACSGDSCEIVDI